MSMQDRLPNSASVNRLFGDSSTELIAIFQYSGDAERFAQMKIAEDAAAGYPVSTYIVTCTYSGRIKVFPPNKKVEATP